MSIQTAAEINTREYIQKYMMDSMSHAEAQLRLKVSSAEPKEEAGYAWISKRIVQETNVLLLYALLC